MGQVLQGSATTTAAVRRVIRNSQIVKKTLFGKYEVLSHSGTKGTWLGPSTWARNVQDRGAGEIMSGVRHLRSAGSADHSAGEWFWYKVS